MAERRWFGEALWWGRDNGTSYVAHAGRRHPLVRVTVAEAHAYGNGTRAGWHLGGHPGQRGDGVLGPWLGKFVRHARALAEAWVLAPESDRDPAMYAPSLITTLMEGGTVFVDAAGRSLSAYPVAWEKHIEIRDRRNDAVGRVIPWFQYGDDGDVAELQWIGKVGQAVLTAQPSFHASCAEIGRVLAAGGGGRG